MGFPVEIAAMRDAAFHKSSVRRPRGSERCDQGQSSPRERSSLLRDEAEQAVERLDELLESFAFQGLVHVTEVDAAGRERLQDATRIAQRIGVERLRDGAMVF